jgi:mono/diheme cytochrome c family protein
MDDQLLQQVAEIRGMPASLVERSAQARAEKTGTTVEAVLREWLGEAAEEPATSAPEPEPATETPASSETVPAPEAPPTEITTDYLVQLAAEARRMPAKLILSSAEARAKHSGSSLDSVLAEWAGVDLDDLKEKAAKGEAPTAETPAPEAAKEPEAPAEEPPAAVESAPVATATVAAGAALSMDELLEKVAEVKGMPASLAKRSAEARAKKTGEPIEAVLAEWAGVDPSSVAAAAPAATTAATVTAPAEDVTSSNDDTAVEPEVEILEASADTGRARPADEEPVPGKRGGYPIWLAATFLLIPLLAVIYILVSPNGPDCGSGGQLLVDPATGEAVNCDGSAYGETTVDNFAAGGSLYQQCAACHSADGSGGVGPAFSAGAVLATFPAGSCADQIEWVAIGTGGWPDPTYGATNKPVGGVGLMPGFGASFSEEQVAQVVLYERVAFGGQPLEEAEVDCGLIEAAEEG